MLLAGQRAAREDGPSSAVRRSGTVDEPTPARVERDEDVVWKAAIRGRGGSSPVIANGRVWVTTAVTEARGVSLRALAFDVESGKELVNVDVFRLSNGNLKNSKNSHASPTPILDGDRVYLHFGGEGTAAIDATSGASVWKALPYASAWGRGYPALYKDILISAGRHYEAWVLRSTRIRQCGGNGAPEAVRPGVHDTARDFVGRPRSGRQRRRVPGGGLNPTRVRKSGRSGTRMGFRMCHVRCSGTGWSMSPPDSSSPLCWRSGWMARET